MPTRLYRARWVLPIVAPPIEWGGVLIAGNGRVVDVGAFDTLRPDHRGPEEDLGEAVVLPGLVNAHTHLDLSALAGRTPRTAGFGDWLASVGAAAAQLQEAEIDQAAMRAIQAVLDSGTVLVGDVTGGGRSVPALLSSRLAARVFHELIGFDPRRAEAVFRDATALAAACEMEEGAAPLRHALAAHAPYSVSSRLLRLIRGHNGAHDAPGSIHLAESQDEEVFFMEGIGSIAGLKEKLGTTQAGWEPPRQAPVVYLQRLGWFEARGLCVHCVHLGARGIELLRRAGMTACLCVRSNLQLGVGAPPAAAMRAAGLQLALGTDSLASCPTLSLFDELEVVGRTAPEVEPQVWIEAATLGGARGLGFDDLYGSIAPGKRAPIAVSAGGEVLREPYALLMASPKPAAIRHLDPALNQPLFLD